MKADTLIFFYQRIDKNSYDYDFSSSNTVLLLYLLEWELLSLVNDFLFQYKIKGNPSNEQVVYLFDTNGILKY